MDERKLRDAGIDYDAALARFVGKREIYEKYLTKFLEDTHDRRSTAIQMRNKVTAIVDCDLHILILCVCVPCRSDYIMFGQIFAKYAVCIVLGRVRPTGNTFAVFFD